MNQQMKRQELLQTATERLNRADTPYAGAAHFQR